MNHRNNPMVVALCAALAVACHEADTAVLSESIHDTPEDRAETVRAVKAERDIRALLAARGVDKYTIRALVAEAEALMS